MGPCNMVAMGKSYARIVGVTPSAAASGLHCHHQLPCAMAAAAADGGAAAAAAAAVAGDVPVMRHLLASCPD